MNRKIVVIVGVVGILFLAFNVYQLVLRPKLTALPLLPSKIVVQKTYDTMNLAFNEQTQSPTGTLKNLWGDFGGDYTNYPSPQYSKPKQLKDTNLYVNPVTDFQLSYVPGFGKGGGCCEAPSLSVLQDKNDHLFWVYIYQASMAEVNKNWYGPFKYINE